MNKINKLISIFVLFLTVNFAVSVYAQEPVKLTKPQLGRGKLLMQALNERESTRSFSQEEIPIDLISNLLWAAWGINRQESGKRTAPSAKNMQEIDVYVAMKKGLYLYNPKENMLEPILSVDIREFTGTQDFTQSAPINLIYVADLSKMSGGQDEKIFYSAVDAGFIIQNVYLFCASEGLATVVLGWVDKPELEKIMLLPKDKKVILTQPVGYPRP